ncbi:sulfatase [Flavicella sp.]|uniref:sulfatase family protein n=1 Tax=Flavicella sp. TaxID=2957742 RepID=UPI00301AD52E
MIKKIRLLKYSLLLIVINTSLFCNGETRQLPPPNIVWLVSEDNSMHYLKMFNENGVETPHIESLANQGLIYTRAFSNTAVCSAARSTIISGCYGPKLASHYHRSIQKVPMPDNLEMFPAYLKKGGYYTSNNSKEDYNIVKGNDVWDDSSKKATWRNRGENQPFFHVFNTGITHEGSLHFNKETYKKNKTKTGLETFSIQPNHPKTKLFKYTNALYRDKIIEMDAEIGKIINQLKDDGLYNATFIFYYGDHGGVLPGSKGYLYETGLHVPMVVHIPEKYKHLVPNKLGSSVSGFVSFVDLAPTVLNLAGIKIPKIMDGKPFLGKNITAEDIYNRDESFSYADRFDEKYDMVRAIRKGKYKYIRNYQPFNFDGLMNNYRYKQLAYKEWAELYKKGVLNKKQSDFFMSRSPELLFNVEDDPYETNNLAENPAFRKELLKLRNRLNSYIKQLPDLSFYPEHFLIEKAFDNPVVFGENSKIEIEKYLNISNLSLLTFKEAKNKIEKALNSKDPWERYWGIITCSNFGKEAMTFASKINEISITDSEAINKVRALEYKGLFLNINPLNEMTEILYKSTSIAESLLILNTMTLITDSSLGFKGNYEFELISEEIKKNKDIQNRLQYLSSK